MMTPERLQELLSEYIEQPLAPRQLEQLLAYLDLLLKWNAKTNLTAIREPEQIVRRHFGESLALAEMVDELAGIETSADLGSGAGFPGLPLAIFCPEIKVTLVESQNKKATFLKEVVRTLDLPNVSVLNQRAEEVALKFDLVTMRAVERFTQALLVGTGMLRDGGYLGLLVSAEQLPQIKNALAHRNMTWHDESLPENARAVLGSTFFFSFCGGNRC
jgi:16S rRNA (guanine527-N7)-methyltransferase